MWGRCSIFALVLLFCAPVEANRAAVRKAKALFKKAELEYRLGNFALALTKYKAALRLTRRPSLIFNIAQCHRYLRQPDRALFFYELYLSDWKRVNPAAPRPPNFDEVREYIANMRKALVVRPAAPKEGKLLLTGLPPGAEVRIDGETRGRAPLSDPIRLAAGRYRVEVLADGFEMWSKRVKIRAGAEIERSVTLRQRRMRAHRKRGHGWLVTAIVTASIALGSEIGALISTSKANDAIRDSSDFKTASKLAITGHIVAGSFAVISAVSFYLQYRSKSGADRRASLSVTPTVSGALLSGRLSF